jgi:hypothetical protein
VSAVAKSLIRNAYERRKHMKRRRASPQFKPKSNSCSISSYLHISSSSLMITVAWGSLAFHSPRPTRHSDRIANGACGQKQFPPLNVGIAGEFVAFAALSHIATRNRTVEATQ